jgi:outer membrane protein assembly factor BamA
MASAAVVSIGYDQRWDRPSGLSHTLEASYQLRSATDALGSDLEYKRHLGRTRYQYEQGHSTVTASVSLGRITGRAPLFERFSLGDSATLRGWNKFDIAPAGGDSMFHQSIEYAYRHFALFVDTGSVWDDSTDSQVRVSTGFGYHTNNVFLTLGFPLNASEVGAAFMMGVRF